MVVGNYYVCTVRETGVWVALDDRFTKTGDYWPTTDELSSWGWVPDEPGKEGSYPNYKDKSRRTKFSIDGRYSVGENHNDSWPHVRRLFFDFIYKAIYHGQSMNKKSPELHSQDMLRYMRHYLGVDFPDPLYRSDARCPQFTSRGLFNLISVSASVKRVSEAPVCWPELPHFPAICRRKKVSRPGLEPGTYR